MIIPGLILLAALAAAPQAEIRNVRISSPKLSVSREKAESESQVTGQFKVEMSFAKKTAKKPVVRLACLSEIDGALLANCVFLDRPGTGKGMNRSEIAGALKASGVNVVYAPDLQPYRTRKVRFLNATHTTMVYLGLEKGFTEVAQCIADPDFNKFVRQVIFDEIFPTVNLPDAEKKEYAESVLERFANPFAHHQLKSIALNTIAKWKDRKSVV